MLGESGSAKAATGSRYPIRPAAFSPFPRTSGDMKITPEMVRAGVATFREELADDLPTIGYADSLVRAIFSSMMAGLRCLQK